MIEVDEASRIALEFAINEGYSTISLIKDSYKHIDFGICFVFSPEITEEEITEIRYVGLPEYIFVDKLTSFVFSDRILL